MKKKIFVSILIIGILIASIVIFRRIKNKKANSGQLTNDNTAAISENSNFPLKKGSRGENVKILQNAINNVMPSVFIPLNIDGIFGDKTLSALQNHVGLSQITQPQFNKLVSLATTTRGLLIGSKALSQDELLTIQNA